MSALAKLREDFDASFSMPRAGVAEEIEDILLIRVAGDSFAVPLRDVAGVITNRTITPLRAAADHLLGLSGVRGDIVPVFALASVLGYDRLADPPRWMILCGEPPLAMAFSDIEGYLRVPRSSIRTADDDAVAGTRQYLPQVVTTDIGNRPVIALPRIIATIQKRAAPTG